MEENSVIREAMLFAVVRRNSLRNKSLKSKIARCSFVHFAFDWGGVPAPLPLFLLGRLF